MTVDAAKTYGSHEAAAMAGVSYRQLDYWDRTGLIRPTGVGANGSGSRRRYSERDIENLRLVKRLLELGLDMAHIRRTDPEQWLRICMAFALAGVS